MRSEDFAEFRAVIEDMCASFDRTCTDAKVKAFYEPLKRFHIADLKRQAAVWKANFSKMPTPRELMPQRTAAPPPVQDEGSPMSSWAIAANQILFSVAYQGHRGFQPIAKWETTPERGWGLPLKKPNLVDGSRLEKCLARKAEYVRMAEDAEAGGDVWEPQEFNRMCREGFEALLA
jgi:hypothetical protein